LRRSCIKPLRTAPFRTIACVAPLLP
jgi:hypothetical protein